MLKVLKEGRVHKVPLVLKGRKVLKVLLEDKVLKEDRVHKEQ